MIRVLSGNKKRQKIKATVVLMPKNVLDFNVISGSLGGAVGGAIKRTAGQLFDTATAFLGHQVSMQLISATKIDGNLICSLYLHSFNSFTFL